MPTDLDAFFADYADSYNQALGAAPDYDRIRRFFSDCFVGAGPLGVHCGPNDDSFTKALREGYAFYKAIRTRRMNFRRVETTPIDERHVMARVFYRADYERASGEPLSIDFDVVYMLETAGERPRIFAFVAGDELGLYRRHGLVDAAGKPVG